MTKKERIAVAVTGVVLFCVAAVFSISIFLGALDFGFSSRHNVLFLLGRMLFSVYGFCSVLIPVFFFVAGAFCLSANWSVQRAFILLISVIPFFTLVLAERTSFSIAAQEANPVAGVKIISLVAIALLLVALEYLIAVTVAGFVEKALEQQFSFKDTVKNFKNNVKTTILQVLNHRKEENTIAQSKDEKDETDIAAQKNQVQTSDTSAPSPAVEKASDANPHPPLEWSVDSEGNVKEKELHEQNTPSVAQNQPHLATVGTQEAKTADSPDTSGAIDVIDEFEKNSMDLTVRISRSTVPQTDFEIYDDGAGVKSETPGDDERFFDDEFLEDDFDEVDDDIEEIDDDFEDQEYLSAIDETEIQEIDTPEPASDDFEFYAGFQQESEEEPERAASKEEATLQDSDDSIEEPEYFDEVQDTEQQSVEAEQFDKMADALRQESEPEYFDEPVASGTDYESAESEPFGKIEARRSSSGDRQISTDEREYSPKTREGSFESSFQTPDDGEGEYFDEPAEDYTKEGREYLDEAKGSQVQDSESEYFDEPPEEAQERENEWQPFGAGQPSEEKETFDETSSSSTGNTAESEDTQENGYLAKAAGKSSYHGEPARGESETKIDDTAKTASGKGANPSGEPGEPGKPGKPSEENLEYFDEVAGNGDPDKEVEYFDEPVINEEDATSWAAVDEVQGSQEPIGKPFDDRQARKTEPMIDEAIGNSTDSTPKNAQDGQASYSGESADEKSEYFDETDEPKEKSEPEVNWQPFGIEQSNVAERIFDESDNHISEDFPEPALENTTEEASALDSFDVAEDSLRQDESSTENDITQHEDKLEGADEGEPVIEGTGDIDDIDDTTEESEWELEGEPRNPDTSKDEASYTSEDQDNGESLSADELGKRGEAVAEDEEPKLALDETGETDDDFEYPDASEGSEDTEESEITVVDDEDFDGGEESELEVQEYDDEGEEGYSGEVSEGEETFALDEPLAGDESESDVQDEKGDEHFTSLESIFKKMERDAKTLAQKSLPSNDVSLPPDQLTHAAGSTEDIRPRRSIGAYKIPEDLLTVYEENPYWIIDQETENASKCLKDTLSEFKIEAEVTGIRKGPVVTMFEILPAPGVKLSRIVALSDNIALRLAASSVRIVAPIPGKRAVGIEVPNKNRAIVSFRECIEEQRAEWQKMAVPVVLGKDIQGETQIMDLVKTPHLLIAGSTGAGKSVCVNSMILSILYKRAPHEVKLILVDPKIVELKLYNGIPHLLTPVITEPKKAMQALQYCLCEMERRYSVLDGMGCRDIASYNRKIVEQHIAAEKLPYIIVIIDEFADLMATTGKALESVVARLAAMSRAVGIHLVLATQRPSVDVITGLIKANIPSRIAFMVAAKMDSRIIIDQVGAEKLLGKGDMLYASSTDPFPVRIQGAFVSDQEVENVAQAAKEWGEPEYIDDEIFVDDEDEGEQTDVFGDGEDPLYEKALDAVIQAGKASASYVQRKLSIGYNRAARLIEQMEERGIVGPANGSKPREIIHVP